MASDPASPSYHRQDPMAFAAPTNSQGGRSGRLEKPRSSLCASSSPWERSPSESSIRKLPRTGENPSSSYAVIFMTLLS